jgi:hypothetical protein
VSNKYGRIQKSPENLTQSCKDAKRRQTIGIAAKRHKKRKKIEEEKLRESEKQNSVT